LLADTDALHAQVLLPSTQPAGDPRHGRAERLVDPLMGPQHVLLMVRATR